MPFEDALVVHFEEEMGRAFGKGIDVDGTPQDGILVNPVGFPVLFDDALIRRAHHEVRPGVEVRTLHVILGTGKFVVRAIVVRFDVGKKDKKIAPTPL